MDYNAVKLSPAFKDYFWGGLKLKNEYNKKSDFDIIAESWELSTHKDGQSIINGGEFDGLTLSEYIKKNGNEALGENSKKFPYFPILIKFIDAFGNLSIQVHPDDEYAMRVEGEYGKTEMWYILECDDNAYLYYGVNREISKEEFKERIEKDTVLEVLNKVNIKKGDVLFIPAGTIHAICSGTVICEIQQNSNTTYRVYDYHRLDKFGNARELHIEKAIEVAKLTPSPKIVSPDKSKDDVCLASCDKFTSRRLKINGSKFVDITTDSFHSVIITDGKGTLSVNGKKFDVLKGDSFFVPAQNSKYELSGELTAILSYV